MRSSISTTNGFARSKPARTTKSASTSSVLRAVEPAFVESLALGERLLERDELQHIGLLLDESLARDHDLRPHLKRRSDLIRDLAGALREPVRRALGHLRGHLDEQVGAW